MLAYGPVFCLDDDAHCQLKVEHSILSCPEPDILIEQLKCGCGPLIDK